MMTSTQLTNNSHLPALRAETGCDRAQISSPTTRMRPGLREALDASERSLCDSIVVESPMEVALRKEEGGFLDKHEVSEVDLQPDSPQKMARIVKILRTKDDEGFYGFLRWLFDFGNNAQGRELAGAAGLERAIATEPGDPGAGPQRVRLRPVAVVKPLEARACRAVDGTDEAGAPANGAPDGRDSIAQLLGRTVRTCRIARRDAARLAIFSTMAICATATFFVVGMGIGSWLPFVGAGWGGCILATVGAGISIRAATQVGGREDLPDRPEDVPDGFYGQAAEVPVGRRIVQELREMAVDVRRAQCWDLVRFTNAWTVLMCDVVGSGLIGAVAAEYLWASWQATLGSFVLVALGSMALTVSLIPGERVEQRIVDFLNRPTNQGARAPQTVRPG